MASRDHRLERLDRVLLLYRGGGYTELEVAYCAMALADSAIVADLVRALPPEVFSQVKQYVDAAPTTEEGWASQELLGIRSGPETATTRAERLAAHRAAIEALRWVLNAGLA